MLFYVNFTHPPEGVLNTKITKFITKFTKCLFIMYLLHFLCESFVSFVVKFDFLDSLALKVGEVKLLL